MIVSSTAFHTCIAVADRLESQPNLLSRTKKPHQEPTSYSYDVLLNELQAFHDIPIFTILFLAHVPLFRKIALYLLPTPVPLAESHPRHSSAVGAAGTEARTTKLEAFSIRHHLLHVQVVNGIIGSRVKEAATTRHHRCHGNKHQSLAHLTPGCIAELASSSKCEKSFGLPRRHRPTTGDVRVQ